MKRMLNLIQDSSMGVCWEYENKKICIPYENKGGAIYSQCYDLVVIMQYHQGIDKLRLSLKAYNIDGSLKAKINPNNNENVAYEYIMMSKACKSGIVVIGTYDENVANFPQWQFEVDLDKFEITNRIAPAY